MAATLKLGNANWAAKEGSLLAYNDENDNFKPLPFDFTRASSATYVASDGLIKTSTTGQPRIDFLDNTNGTLLLEPQRTNLITYSEDFSNSYWVKNGASVTSGIVSPDGTTNSFKLVEDTSTARHETQAPSSSSGNLSTSFFAKKGENSFIQITNSQDANAYANFDLNSGVLGSSNVFTPTIIDYGNGWYRCIATINAPLAINFARIGLITSSTSARVESYTGDGTSGVYIWGAQLEAGTFPTSYIPTSGSTVTRVAETCSQTPASGVIGQTEGTVFFDVNISHIVGNEALGGINSGGYANHATIQRIGNTIQFVRNSATQSGATIVTSSAITVGRYKLALAYKSGDTACFLNGTQVSTTQTQTFTNATLNLIRISGDAIGALPISDTYNQAQLYNTRLSNSELATLTTI